MSYACVYNQKDMHVRNVSKCLSILPKGAKADVTLDHSILPNKYVSNLYFFIFLG